MEDSVRGILSDCQLYKSVHSLLHDLYELYKNPLNRVALKVISFAKSNRHKDFKIIQPPNLSAQNKGSGEHSITAAKVKELIKRKAKFMKKKLKYWS